jgi:hypothetical protein
MDEKVTLSGAAPEAVSTVKLATKVGAVAIIILLYDILVAVP